MSHYLDRFRLDGRTAFVTGGAQGIGLCVAEALAEAGALVTIADRDSAALASAVAQLAAKGFTVAPVVLDVTDSVAVDAAAAAMRERHARIAAGHSPARLRPLTPPDGQCRPVPRCSAVRTSRDTSLA